MIFKVRPVRQWIPAILAGIFFVMSGCQTRGPIEETKTAASPPQDASQGDEYFRKGAYDRALEAYALALERDPAAPQAPQILFSMGEIRFTEGRWEEAAALFERILREHPGYPEADRVKIRSMECRYRLGAYEEVVEAARLWLQDRPEHPLRKRALVLAGLGHEALGDDPSALRAYLISESTSGEELEMPEDPGQRIPGLIDGAAPETLEPLVPLAAGTAFAPHIYHRLAIAYLDQGDYEKSMDAAMALVRSTPEDAWVREGRDLLDRIESERMVRRGVIGCLLPLSGDFGIYGQEVLNGIELGLALSPRGAMDLELVIRDTQAEAGRALSEMEVLVRDEGVVGIIGPLSSKASVAASKKAQALGVPMILLSQKEGLTLEGDMIFRNFLPPSREIKALLDKVTEDFDLRRFAVLYPENPYGRYLLDLFREEVSKKGGVLTAVESYGEEETDFAEQIKKMVRLDPPRPKSVVESLKLMRTLEQEENEIEAEEPQPEIDFEALFIPDSHHRVVMIAPQLLYHDVKGVFLLGTSLWHAPELMKMAAGYLQGAIFPVGFFPDSEDPEVASFVQAYKAQFASEPTVLAATGYDTVRFLASLLGGGAVRSRGDLQRALTEVPPFAGVTGPISFDGTGEVLRDPLLLSVSGDRLRILPPPY